jgi:hypothetical protein
MMLFWEQEVPSSNLGAPTIFLSMILAGCIDFQPAIFLDKLGDFAYFIPNKYQTIVIGLHHHRREYY